MEFPGLAASASAWGVRAWIARALFGIPIAASAVLLATPLYYHRLSGAGQWRTQRAFQTLFREDGPVEWAQALGFLVGCVAAVLLARRLLQEGRRAQAAFFGLGALGLFLVFGEELSWGQRIFGVVTPEWLAEINRQDELNVHNIGTVRKTLDYPKMLISAWGLLAGLLDARIRRLALVRRVGFPLSPPVFLAPWFAVTLTYDVLRRTAWKEPGFFVQLASHGEWAELCLAVGMAGFLVLAWREARQGARPPSRGTSPPERWPVR